MNLDHLFSVMSTETLAEKSQLHINGSSVILANCINVQAANDHHKTNVAVQLEPLKKEISITDLSHQLAGQVKHGDGVKPPMENEHLSHKTKEQRIPHIEESPLTPKNEENRDERNSSFDSDKITPTVKTSDLNFQDRQRYTTNELLTRHERPLFNHLLTCPYCHIEKAQYCVNGYATGSVYDALLLNRDDAQAIRESLALRIDRACISGRSVFVPFTSSDAPPPPNTAPITRKYGHTPDYEAFINHWTACKVCKPNLGRYCIEGQKLKEVANC